MSSPVSLSRGMVAFATLAWMAACSYDFDRFAGSGGGGSPSTVGLGGGSTDSTVSTGGGRGGSGDAAGVGGAGGTSTAGAAGNAGAVSAGGADAGVDTGSTREGSADSAPTDASDVNVRDAAVDRAVGDACVGIACGPCTSTTECSCESHNGHNYRFCTTIRSWTDAEIQCAGAAMRFARVDDVFENAWIRSTADAHAIGETWIGVEDPMKTLHWQWSDGTQFWTGGASGSPVGGLYNAWDPGNPTGNSVRNCASMMSSASSGQWQDRSCTSQLPYVCEFY